MAVTTVPVTMRVDKRIVALAKKAAKSNDTYYQTELNKGLFKAFGVEAPVVASNKKIAKGRGVKAVAKKAKTLKRPKTPFKLKPSSKFKKDKQ